ncbi:hypothetical protein PENSPDRAFT_738083 [Peniophora sp. CONT]|nr:hypothetical protein PENSPDRAFT_738083 [Peniophora sp. CONT]
MGECRYLSRALAKYRPFGEVWRVIGALLGAVAICIKPVLVLAGFTAKGVAAGSFAALWQSIIGNVVRGSVFALLQSLGMGAMLSWIWPIGLVLAAISAFVGW